MTTTPDPGMDAPEDEFRTERREGERDNAWSARCGLLFEDLRRPARAMIARAYGKALSNEEIEDIYSSAWTATLSALRKREKEMSEPELRAYVLTAVASHASKELRRRSRKPTGTLDEAQDSVIADRHQPLPEERAIGSESQNVARDLLSSLPARRRAVMLLRYGWGLSPDEVCALITGLSRRAYRKEVTRGVEQLIERLGQIDSGDWCRSREPMLRDYLAGTADEATRLQVEQHMKHCRACASLATRLRDELNDLGGVIALGAAAGLVTGLRAPILDRFTSFVQGGRESATVAVEKAELAVGTISTSGGAKGVGAAGAGIAAKLTGFGGVGKAAMACLGAGAAATACVAAGVVPGVSFDGFEMDGESTAKEVPALEARPTRPSSVRAVPDGPPAPPPTNPVADPAQPPAVEDPPAQPDPEQPADVTPAQEFEPTAPVPQTVPPVTADPGGGSPGPSQPSGSAGGSGGGSVAGEEFGP